MTTSKFTEIGRALREHQHFAVLGHVRPYGDLVHVDPTAPATAQILFELITDQQLPIDSEIAENLFVAISTDTGSFQYPNTTARTFEIAAELIRCGVDVGRISQLTYENYPRRRIELLRELLGTMRFNLDG